MLLSANKDRQEELSMKLSACSLESGRGAVRLALFALSVSAVSAISAQAQTTTTTPRAEFENAVITSTTNTINAVRVPVLNSQGVLTYDDITFTVDVDNNGVVTFGSTSSIASSQPVQTDGFQAGTYVGPGGSPTITVSALGVAPGGATEWSLAQSGTTCSFPFSATWYVGPLSSNPVAARLKEDGITSTAYSYGILGTSANCGNNDWDHNALLGFSQTGKSITIVSFTVETTDHSTPIDQITYTLK
jgi:hypothetical protein